MLRDQFDKVKEVCDKCGRMYAWKHGLCRGCYDVNAEIAAEERAERKED